jgi:hypothetical protein
MASDTPPAIVDALFRFFSDDEFDDSPVVDTVTRVTLDAGWGTCVPRT